MLNKEQIMEILPHRPPMLLVDEILEMDENHVVGALHLTGDEHYYVISAAQQPEAVIFNVGDRVTIRFADGEGTILTADSVTRTAAQTAPVVEETETDGAA